MFQRSPLTDEHRLAAVDLFEAGLRHCAVSSRLEVSVHVVGKLETRFKIWGRTPLRSKPTKPVYGFEFNLARVRQFLNGEGPSLRLQ